MNLIEPAAPVSSAAVGTAAGYHWGYLDGHASKCDDHSEDNAGAPAEAHAEAHAGAQWRLIHHRLLELASQQAELDYEQGQLLRAALQAGVHVELGYGSFVEYSERVMGHSPRQTGERLRVAEALEELPKMAKALRTGQLCWSVIRELSRVAVPETESEWLQEAAGKTARDVEKSVSGKQKGQRPADPVAPEVKTHRLSFEVSAEVLATFRDAVDKLRRDTSEKLSEEEALMMMARQALGGPGQEGRAGYQVAMTVCECCEQGYQQVRGELVPVGSEAVERALCDAQHIGLAAGTGEGTHVGTGTGTAPHETHVGTGTAPGVCAAR